MMKEEIKKRKELIRIISFIPTAAIIPVYPINIVLLGIQLTCLCLMFWVGWEYND